MNLVLKYHKDCSFEEFKEFLDSLTTELETWSLDKQLFKTEKEWFFAFKDSLTPSVFCYDEETNKIVAIFSSHLNPIGQDHHINESREEIPIVTHSYIVKKEYQGNSIAKQGLEYYMNYINSKIVKQNPEGLLFTLRYTIVDNKNKMKWIPMPQKYTVHYARTFIDNVGSRNLCKSLGFTEHIIENNRVEYIKIYNFDHISQT
jgi:RimJ/RimL family protein N-acetyltransferase